MITPGWSSGSVWVQPREVQQGFVPGKCDLVLRFDGKGDFWAAWGVLRPSVQSGQNAEIIRNAKGTKPVVPPTSCGGSYAKCTLGKTGSKRMKKEANAPVLLSAT